MNESELINLQVSQFSKLDLQSLKSYQAIARIEELAEDAQYLSEPMSAREFYEALEELLNKFGGQINGTELYKKLFLISIQMQWLALPALDRKNKQNILGENLLYAIRNQIDVSGAIADYLSIYEDGVGPDYNERQLFTNSLTRNPERLGNELLTLKNGEKVPPQVANWIRDFVSYADPKSLKGESYELTQYLYSSPNAKKLAPADRQSLVEILGIYNYLRHPKYLPQIEPASAPVPRVIDNSKPKLIETVSSSTHGAPLEAFKAKMEAGTVVKFAPNVKTQISSPPLGEMSRSDREGRVKMTPDEIKREVKTPELPGHMPPAVANTLSRPVIRPDTLPQRGRDNLNNIQTIDDLKKLDLAYLRTGNLQQQTLNLKSLILNLSRANHVLPYYVVSSFEQSPLFKSYMAHGNSRVLGSGPGGDMTQAEFEAMADLRKEIERL